MLTFTVYSKPNCPHCESAKKFITLQGDTFKEIVIGEGISREEFMEKFPGVRTAPYIVYENVVVREELMNVPIGGFDMLKEFYRTNQVQHDAENVQ